MPNRNHWLGVVSRSHVQAGVQGGFIQLNHGKKALIAEAMGLREPHGKCPGHRREMNTSTVLVRALLAYSVNEHQAGTATQLCVTLQSRSCTVQNNGRGMGLDRDGPVRSELAQGDTGTCLMFTLPDEAPEIDCDEVLAQVEIWRTAHAGLKIDVVLSRLLVAPADECS